MKSLATLALAASTLAPLGIAAEVVVTKERAYLVRYSDASTERYAVKWTLDVAATVRDEGGSFVPYQGASENRRCAWSVASNVERSVALVTRLGQTIALAGMGRNLPGEGKATPPLTGVQPGACTGAREAAGAVAEARRAATASFESLVESDLRELQDAARARPDVAAVTTQ